MCGWSSADPAKKTVELVDALVERNPKSGL
jgi:hypothetical protein